MTHLKDLQPTAAVLGILLNQVVTAVYEATGIDRAKIMYATNGLAANTQCVEIDFFLRASAPFLDAWVVAPDPQESEQ